MTVIKKVYARIVLLAIIVSPLHFFSTALAAGVITRYDPGEEKQYNASAHIHYGLSPDKQYDVSGYIYYWGGDDNEIDYDETMMRVIVRQIKTQQVLETVIPVSYDRHSDIFPFYWVNDRQFRIGDSGDYDSPVHYYDLAIRSNDLIVKNNSVSHGTAIVKMMGDYVVSMSERGGVVDVHINHRITGETIYNRYGTSYTMCFDEYHLDVSSNKQDIYLYSAYTYVTLLWRETAEENRFVFMCFNSDERPEYELGDRLNTLLGILKPGQDNFHFQ